MPATGRTPRSRRSRRLRSEHALAPAAVRAIELTVAPALLDICDVAEPASGLEAKFSLRATAAMALLGRDTGDPGAFADACVDAELRAVAARVEVRADAALTDWQARAAIALGDGGTVAACVDLEREPLPALERKFMRLAAPVLGPARAAAVAALVDAAGTGTGVRELMAAVRVGR